MAGPTPAIPHPLHPHQQLGLNLVERWFGELTRKQIRRGAFKSVDQLKAAIQSFVDQHNANPKGFVWTKTAQQILAKVDRARRSLQALDKPPISVRHYTRNQRRKLPPSRRQTSPQTRLNEPYPLKPNPRSNRSKSQPGVFPTPRAPIFNRSPPHFQSGFTK